MIPFPHTTKTTSMNDTDRTSPTEPPTPHPEGAPPATGDEAGPPAAPTRLSITLSRTREIQEAIRRGRRVHGTESEESEEEPDLRAFREQQHEREREEATRHSYALRRERLNQAWRSVPYGFRWARFGDQLAARVRPPAAIAVARSTLDDFVARGGTGSMVMMGPTASGKTSLAVACLRWFVQQAERVARRLPIATGADRQIYRLGAEARFVTAYDLAKAAVYSQLGRRPELVERALHASVLVLDELGMDVEVYRHSATSVSEVIHERHAEHRPTIITTYLTKELVQKQYGAGIARRIFEGRAIVLRKE